MESISSYMEESHQRCDELFIAVERAVAETVWGDAGRSFELFQRALERHFEQEEEVLFPAIEEAIGTAMGPTRVMRLEHEQMRGLLGEMERALAERDANAFLGGSEILLVLMQQHNAKEEQIVYPLSDQVLAADPEDVLARLKAMKMITDAGQ